MTSSRPLGGAAAVAALGMLLAGCAEDTTSAGSEGDHTTGEHTSTVECGSSTYDDGHQVIRYCGDGRADVRLAGTAPVGARGASCEAHGDFVTANFGTNYSNPKAAEGNYVGLLVGGLRQGDDPRSATVTQVDVTLDGERIAVSDAKVTGALTDSSLEATLTGSTPDGEVEVTATCPVR